MFFSYLVSFFDRLAFRLSAALSSVPSIYSWWLCAALLLVLTIISLPIGFYFGFLKFGMLNTSKETIVGIIAGSLLSPAISEELFFRILLLPHPTENASNATLWLWGCISLAIFIVYHPLNALSFFPAGLNCFFHPVFLLLATFLGIACTIVYLQSGSLWPPVFIHWLVVVVWLLLLGGYGRLHQ